MPSPKSKPSSMEDWTPTPEQAAEIEACAKELTAAFFDPDPEVHRAYERKIRERADADKIAAERAGMAGHGAIGALIRAAYEGDPAAALAALDEGARAGAADGHGTTALMLACRRGHAEVAKLLLQRGANPDAKGHGARRALDEAIASKSHDCIRALLDAGARADLRMSDASDGDHVGAVAVFARDPAPMDPWGPWEPMTRTAGKRKGDQPLAVACMSHHMHPTTIRMLLDAGADPNDANRFGVTPLMIAASAWQPDLWRTLILAGADPSARDAQGRDAIDHARDRGMSEADPEWIGAVIAEAAARREAELLRLATASARGACVDAPRL